MSVYKQLHINRNKYMYMRTKKYQLHNETNETFLMIQNIKTYIHCIDTYLKWLNMNILCETYYQRCSEQ